jgi:hypothetical protein
MEDERYRKLKKELRPIFEKYKLKNVVLGATEDDCFLGCMQLEIEEGDFIGFSTSVLNAAMLYQYTREVFLKRIGNIAGER